MKTLRKIRKKKSFNAILKTILRKWNSFRKKSIKGSIKNSKREILIYLIFKIVLKIQSRKAQI